MRFAWTALLVVAVLAFGGVDSAGGTAFAADEAAAAAVVPEPATLLLYGMGLLVLAKRLRAR